MYCKGSLTGHSQTQAGFSLLELSIVVLIMGILALVMIPNFSSTDSTRLDTAAHLYAEAMRFARSESMRSEKLYAFSQRNSTRHITVKTVDQGASPWTLVKDVYHPVSKKLYAVKLDKISGMNGITTNRISTFRGTCNTTRKIYFDRQGRAFCVDPENVPVITFIVEFKINGQTRSVLLDGLTGRVSIQ